MVSKPLTAQNRDAMSYRSCAQGVRVAQLPAGRLLNGVSDRASKLKLPNTDSFGKPFEATVVEAVWKRAVPSPDHPPLRVDPYGALIWREGYGNTSSKFGWEIAYRTPPARGGTDSVDNLQALQWENCRGNGRH
jgi:hypothetical protein